jgi:hypothetical protein
MIIVPNWRTLSLEEYGFAQTVMLPGPRKSADLSII